MIRALLVDPGHLWRLDELARASEVSEGAVPDQAGAATRGSGTRCWPGGGTAGGN